jgi:hypothetical protein
LALRAGAGALSPHDASHKRRERIVHMFNRYASPIVTLTPGSRLPVPLDFAPSRDHLGRRNVAVELHVITDLTVSISGGGDAVAAGGEYMALRRIQLADGAGDLVDVSGAAARVLEHRDGLPGSVKAGVGCARHAENPVSSRPDPLWKIYLAPMAGARHRWDFGVPVENVKTLALTAAAAADLSADATITTFTAQVVVVCRPELDDELKCRRVVRELDAGAASSAIYVEIGGASIRNLIIGKADPATSPGWTATDASEITAPALGLVGIPVAELEAAAAAAGHMYYVSGDPLAGGDAHAIVLAEPDSKPHDLPRVSGNLMVTLTGNTVSGLSVISDLIVDRSPLGELAVISRAAGREAVVKTISKTGRSPAAWERRGLANRMPRKVIG